ncbi:MAG: cytochrome c3 family protein [Gammaproteobacteria bacterium]|nr:cytochrome c3 family protein [Gammaproteobacteria bacterium]
MPTTAECNTCHSTITWSGAKVDHSIITGRCDACHNGTTATGKPNGHPVTTSDCNVCHMSTTVWTGAVFTHASANYPGNHNNNVTCTSCHVSSAEVANWTAPQYKPFCAGCHKSTFDATTQKQSHIKTEGPPIVLYSADELKDCANVVCHIYADITFNPAKIKTLRNSRHTVGGTW